MALRELEPITLGIQDQSSTTELSNSYVLKGKKKSTWSDYIYHLHFGGKNLNRIKIRMRRFINDFIKSNHF